MHAVPLRTDDGKVTAARQGPGADGRRHRRRARRRQRRAPRPRPPPTHDAQRAAVKERLFAEPARPNAYHAGGQRQLAGAAQVAAPQAVASDELGLYLAKPHALRRDQVTLRRCARARASSPARSSAASAPARRHAGRRRARREQARRRAGAVPALRDPARRQRRAAHRPDADPRRLEAARHDRRLPLGEPDARRRGLGDDRPDPADEQGTARAPRARQPGRRRSTAAGARTSARASSTGACSPRSSSSPPAA